MRCFFIIGSLLLLLGCDEPKKIEITNIETITRNREIKVIPLEEIDLTMFNKEPQEWGENVSGVKTQFVTDKMEMALTFDACGGPHGNEFDENIITFLQNEAIPATLFVNERWIMENKELFLELNHNPLFQIENHGTAHLPLSVSGREVWGIQGTESVQEVAAEIIENHETVKELTGLEMTLFRAGTAYYDEVAVEIAQHLGYEVVNFDILGDAGATFSGAEVEQALLTAEPGSIALLHMNQPNSGTAAGIKAAIPKLQEAGFSFVHLDGKTFR